MTVDTFSAAKTMGRLGDWQLSNLAMQKILYIVHMIYMGKHDGQPFINDKFEAWDYGPVVPRLYHKIKFFGSGSVKDVFFSSLLIDSGEEFDILQEGVDFALQKRPGQLIAITHAKDGAWDKNYDPNRRNVVIPDGDILDEYHKRFRDLEASRLASA